MWQASCSARRCPPAPGQGCGAPGAPGRTAASPVAEGSSCAPAAARGPPARGLPARAASATLRSAEVSPGPGSVRLRSRSPSWPLTLTRRLPFDLSRPIAICHPSPRPVMGKWRRKQADLGGRGDCRSGHDPGPGPGRVWSSRLRRDPGGDGHWGEWRWAQQAERVVWHGCSLGGPLQRQAVRLGVCTVNASPARGAPSPAPTSPGWWAASLLAVRRAVIAPRAPSCTAQPVSRLGLPLPAAQGSPLTRQLSPLQTPWPLDGL